MHRALASCETALTSAQRCVADKLGTFNNLKVVYLFTRVCSLPVLVVDLKVRGLDDLQRGFSRRRGLNG